MGGQTVEEFGVRLGDVEEPFVDLIGGEKLHPARAFLLEAHADPDVGVEVVDAFGRLEGILFPRHVGGVAGEFEVRLLGRRDHELHARELGGEHERIGDVAPAVAVEGHSDRLVDAPAVLFDRHEVGEDLARVEVVGESVYDRYGRHARQLFDALVREGADHDPVEIAAEDVRGVADGLAAADLHLGLIEIERTPAEFAHADFEGDPRPGRRLGEDQPDALSGERSVLDFTAFAFELGGEFEDRLQIVKSYIS